MTRCEPQAVRREEDAVSLITQEYGLELRGEA